MSTCTVLEILGPDEMLVRERYVSFTLTFVGGKAQQNFYTKGGATLRLKGFPTKGLTDGQKWEGPAGNGVELAVISTWRAKSEDGSNKTVLLGIPMSQVHDWPILEQFQGLLKQGIKLDVVPGAAKP